MPEIWGGLAKAQNDNERIEEAISRHTAEHNADETSHLLPGQSLQSHKASAIIDHLARSIVTDKLADFAITNEKIADLAVTNAKIADLTVTDGKIASLSANKITAGTIDASQINVINLNADNLTAGTLTGRLFRSAATGNRLEIVEGTNPSFPNEIRFYHGVEGIRGIIKSYWDGGQIIISAQGLIVEGLGGEFAAILQPDECRFGADLIPQEHNWRDLGQSARRWRNLWLSNQLTVASHAFFSGDLVSRRVYPATDGGIALGDPSRRWSVVHTISVRAQFLHSSGLVNLAQITETTANTLFPVNGSVFYDITNHRVRVMINGVWRTITAA